MCVIFACEEEVPNQEILELANEKHGDGIGAAWRPPKGKVGVRFKKGMDLAQLLKLLPTIKDKYPVIHFRAASIGGVMKELTHPFPLVPGADPFMMEGDVPGVLFQNGTWNRWDDELKAALYGGAGSLKIGYQPGTPVSDAWALALLVERFGEMWLKATIRTEGMRVLTWWPRSESQVFKTLWGPWISEHPHTKEKLGWSQSQELFLPKKGGKGSGKDARPMLPGVGGTGSPTTGTSGTSTGVGSNRPPFLYYDDVLEQWVSKEEWFRNFEGRKLISQLKEDAAEDAEVVDNTDVDVYTEEELVALLCETRGLCKTSEAEHAN